MVQTMMFAPLVFEIDVYLRHMKFFRFISLAVASIFNFMYFFILAVWIIQIYDPPEWYAYDMFTGFMNCMVAYNLIFDSMALPINTMIIVKELSMEFF